MLQRRGMATLWKTINHQNLLHKEKKSKFFPSGVLIGMPCDDLIIKTVLYAWRWQSIKKIGQSERDRSSGGGKKQGGYDRQFCLIFLRKNV